MDRLLSHIPSKQSATGIRSTFHDFAWKITGEIEKDIVWYRMFNVHAKRWQTEPRSEGSRAGCFSLSNST